MNQGIAGALSSDGRTITNGPQTFVPGTHTVNQLVAKLAKVGFAIGVVAGVALIGLGIAKLKAHKDNPQQTAVPVPLCTINTSPCK
jgi:hypothetical protein